MKILPEANLDVRNANGVSGLLIRISEGYVIFSKYEYNKMHLLGPNSQHTSGGWDEVSIIRSFLSLTIHQMLLGYSNQGGRDERDMGELGVVRWIILRQIFKQ
jgi:hypothetical protein